MTTEPPIRYQTMATTMPEGTIDLDALIPGDGQLELDIGFGRGNSLFERAEVSPDSRILGVEIKAKWAFRVEARRKRLGLANVRAFSGDIRDVMARAKKTPVLHCVYVHFPDPWWKKRHNKRRVVQTELLDELAPRMVPGGFLYVQTDVQDRGEDYRSLIEAHEAFEFLSPDGYVEVNMFGARSNREVRAEEDGLPVYRIVARRRP